MAVDAPRRNRFLLRTTEDADLNQYWYSAPTIAAILEEVVAVGGRIGFVSTPSLYFSLTTTQREGCAVLDFDKQWNKDPGFVFYDFNAPEDVPAEHHHTFDLLVIDPPFITRDVWEKYAVTAKLLAKEGDTDGVPNGRLLCSTIQENADMMRELLGVEPLAFKPSIPHLVYQYCMYSNYPATRMAERNPEIPEDDDDDDVADGSKK